jgi:hypothetical protein
MRNPFSAAVGLALTVSAAYAGDINWSHDYAAALKMSKSSGKPVMLDFYTDW